ncbi:uncharacterized protein METZ01_LOCUS304744 [marine metagenome]|uniref:Uncharacterized protein n=1 Tax=marine metagenome TaxID=408172 RepID=A0A382MTL0_9ZZZZ
MAHRAKTGNGEAQNLIKLKANRTAESYTSWYRTRGRPWS